MPADTRSRPALNRAGRRSTAQPDKGNIPRDPASPSSSVRSTSTASRENLHHLSRAYHVNSEQLSDSLPYLPHIDFDDDDHHHHHLEYENEVIMAVNINGSNVVGCCYYVAREEKMLFMEDAKLGGLGMVDARKLTLPRLVVFVLTHLVKVYIEPTVILVSNKADDALLERLDAGGDCRISGAGDNDQFNLPFLLEVRPSTEFGYESGQTKLASLSLSENGAPHMAFVLPGDVVSTTDFNNTETLSGRQRQLLNLAGWIHLESQLSVGCAGALIGYIQRKRAVAYLPGDTSAYEMFRVSTLEMFTLRDTMFVNTDTLHSLQILESESHPNSHNQGPTQAASGSKEGLSLYGLFRNLACTAQGKYLLRQYFLRPSLNLDTINERLDTIDALIRPDNSSIVESLIHELRYVKNMRVVLIHLRKGAGGGLKPSMGKSNTVSNSVWVNLREFAFRALRITDILRAMISDDNIAIKRKVLDNFDGQRLCQLGRRVNEIIDFEQSKEEARTIIRTGVDEELDHMKQTFDGLGSLLAKVEEKLSDTLPSDLRQSMNVIYFPQIGFLTTIPVDPITTEALYTGEFDNPWERMFSTEDQVYFKNNQMREMDDHFGDLYGLISDREIEICHELAQYALEYEALLTTTSDICSELDSLLAMARGAKLYSLSKPHMTHENAIRIKAGRHILQELTVNTFVPNDTAIFGGKGDGQSCDEEQDPSPQPNSSLPSEWAEKREEKASMLILTGPNYSGKSVYIKQTAIIVLLAHVGCFVPAASADIGLTDKILSRVSTRETVSRSQSTFMIDIQQISLALTLVTRRSLLIIDEFGKGTDPSDGAGLACAVFEHLLQRGQNCPKVVAATHFHEIFDHELFVAGPTVTFGHMEVRVDPKTSHMEGQVTHLYNFRDGRSNSSFGTWCASANGVPPEIVQRASELTGIAAKGEDLVAACSVMPHAEAGELEEAEQIARSFLKSEFDQAPHQVLNKILST